LDSILQAKDKLPSSFRDPAGFLFHHEGILFRQINERYHSDYSHLMQSGLYQILIQNNMLIPHQEVPSELGFDTQALVIQPERIPFISYSYEWCFSQLKDAALLTLAIQKIALEHGMILKDASSYNVQFRDGRPIFIDTLSFTRYQEGSPWQAYQQFCQHFLAPLMLMHYKDIRLNQLLKVYIDGIPLDLTSNLLPKHTKIQLSPTLHIHWHAKLQKKYQETTNLKLKKQSFSLAILKHFTAGLTKAVEKLSWPIQKNSEWYEYYEENNNYSSEALNEKEKCVDSWIKNIRPTVVWDLGANTGRFSIIASQYAQQVVAWDIDASCIESFYLHTHQQSHAILPLILDLTNPTPALGWGHHERNSLMERGPADAILALGLIHHLAIVNNVPLDKIAQFFQALTQYLILEFIPKEDSQVQKLLSTREDIFSEYDLTHFERTFALRFDILEKIIIKGSHRTLYLLKNKVTI
jgi:hypothetical protein